MVNADCAISLSFDQFFVSYSPYYDNMQYNTHLHRTEQKICEYIPKQLPT